MKVGDNLFIRIDYPIKGASTTSKDYEDHMEFMKNLMRERKVIGGGFKDENGGMIIFECENLNEAKKIASRDPLILRNLYSCTVHEWEVLINNNQYE
ncbi:YciI family protein [Oceanirhabdus seepicola]|uniref:YCII-related domain-containing protein n=1 Tax=Oceanirhabdus seepicola TaxID=2828781 RepID=A0A9J6P5G1_9CLOT|nr:YciI family protein [Oceanirhabdus seepicola]MCM1991500.1 hypothetical protein [Oceanirhabdus seepicola]